MAIPAHCAYCFEVLAAHFDRRQPLRLAEVEKLWNQFHEPEPARLAEGNDVEGGSDAEIVEHENADRAIIPPRKHAAIGRILHQNSDASQTSSNSSSVGSSPSASSSTTARSSGINTPASSTASSKVSLQSTSSKQSYPLFVTWNTISRSGRKSLRGCIGTFEAQELEDGLQSYALTSALEDVRFSPIPASLLSSLSVHVTLLTNFSAPKKDPMDWVLGTNGLRISFTHHNRRHGSTYLPEIAREQGWTKEETLISLMQKAGWNGNPSEWRRAWDSGRAELITYEGHQVGLSYAEWNEWRDWVKEQSS